MSSLRRPLLSVSRRHFLQATAASLALASSPALAWQEQRPGQSKLHVHEKAPFNAEPPLAQLVKQWETPDDLLFVRCHGKEVPQLALDTFKVTIEGLVNRRTMFSVQELYEKFSKVEQHTTLTCAGNRRYEHSKVKKISGVQWLEGAIGTARWQGTPLSEVLKAVEVLPEAKHIWFEGLDDVEHGGGTIRFGGSIPIGKAMATEGGPPVLLAWRMNDGALPGKPGLTMPYEHGYPLRAIVPGFIGARSVKWLSKITVSDKPSPNHFIADVYKLVPDSSEEAARKANPIYQNVINSAICSPAAGATVKAGELKLTGFALPSGDGRAVIEKVEVSVDGGRTWEKASLIEPKYEPYNWELWQHTVKLKPGKHALAVRAADSSGNTQPEKVDWNAKGYLFNAWHTIELDVT